MKIIGVITLMLFSTGLYSQNTWLWKIKKKGNSHTSYLFGTFHEAGNSVFDSYTNAKKCLNSSEILLVESTDTTTPSPITQEDVNKGFFIWKSLLTEAQQKIFMDYAIRNSMAGFYGLPGEEIVLNLHHDYISRFCSLYARDTLFIMDYQIQLLAEKQQTLIKALDKIISYTHGQDRSITDSIIKTDTSVIKEMISIMNDINMEKKDQEPCKVLDSYLSTSIQYDFGIKNPYLSFSVDTRNMKWMETIKSDIDKNKCFIAVGFNHLRYADGLIMLLRKQGYVVTPIPMK